MRVLARMLLAIIFFVVLTAAIIAVLNTPGIQTSQDGPAEEPASGAITTTRAVPSGVAPAPRRTAGAGTAPRPISPVPPLPGFEAPEPPVVLKPVMQVRRQSVPVFSNNSGDASILRRLDEGAQVETGLAVLNSEGLWVEVQLDQRPFGFVRGEDLGLGIN